MTSPTQDSAIRTPEGFKTPQELAAHILNECIEYWTFDHLPEGNRQEVVQIIADAILADRLFIQELHDRCYETNSKACQQQIELSYHKGVSEERARKPEPSKSFEDKEICSKAWDIVNMICNMANRPDIRKCQVDQVQAIIDLCRAATLAERARVQKCLPKTTESEDYADDRVEQYQHWNCESHKLIRSAVRDTIDWLCNRIGVDAGEGT